MRDVVVYLGEGLSVGAMSSTMSIAWVVDGRSALNAVHLRVFIERRDGEDSSTELVETHGSGTPFESCLAGLGMLLPELHLGVEHHSEGCRLADGNGTRWISRSSELGNHATEQLLALMMSAGIAMWKGRITLALRSSGPLTTMVADRRESKAACVATEGPEVGVPAMPFATLADDGA